MKRDSEPTSAQPAATDLVIDGMSCAACVRRVERALRAVPGVAAATVNLATGQARVAGGAVPALVAAVAGAGYQARLASGAPKPAPRPLWPGLAALALLAPLLPGMAWPRLAVPSSAAALLSGVLLFGVGAPFWHGAWRDLRARAAGMDTLVVLGAGTAWLFSLAQWRAGGATYFEPAAAIIAFVRLGKALEARARQHGADAVRALTHLAPPLVRLLRAGIETDVPAETVEVGAYAVARAGERIALDGVVLEGTSAADESLLTGEAMPAAKTPGAPVIGGTINLDGRLVYKVTATGAETMLARIARLTTEATSAKPALQRAADRVAGVFVPGVLALAVATFGLWLLAGAAAGPALLHAVAVLVVACPCALGLAAPMAVAAGFGAGARAGILLRDPAALDTAPAVRVVAFDKTGTLTTGQLTLRDVETLSDLSAADLYKIAAALEAGSLHPVGRALADSSVPVAAEFQNHPGRGVTGTVAARRYALGTASWLRDFGIVAPDDAGTETGALLAELAPVARPLGRFRFADMPRPGAQAAVAALRRAGLRVVVLSGDTEVATVALAEHLGADEAEGGLLPEAKLAALARLRADGAVAMVGDGVNDAPALAAADVSIAMGEGSAVAMAAAGITLMRNDPRLVPAALDLAARIRRTIRQGLFWAFAYNLLALPLAALGYISPTIAAAAMAASSISVVVNALRLLRWRSGAEIPAG